MNLCAAQVKTAAKLTSTDTIANQLLPCDEEESQETVLPGSCSVSDNSDSDYDESESALVYLNRDINSFVHELTKLFGTWIQSWINISCISRA